MEVLSFPLRVMKKILIILSAALLFVNGGYSQENNVVLDYNQLTLGYTHVSSDTDLDGNGIGLSASSRFGNFVLGVGLGNTWVEDTDASLLQVGGSLGYIFELSDSLHLVPGLSVDYEKVHDWEYYYADGWVLTPSIGLNYALNSSLELSVGVGYSDPFSVDVLGEDVSDYTDGTFVGSIGAEYALTSNLGLRSSFGFSERSNAFAVGISYHY